MYISILHLNDNGDISGFFRQTFLSSQIQDIVRTAPSPIWPYNPNHVFNLPTSPINFHARTFSSNVIRSYPLYPNTNIIKPTAVSPSIQKTNTSFVSKTKDDGPQLIFSENSSFEIKTSPQKKRNKDDDDDKSPVKKKKEEESDKDSKN